MDNSSNAAGSGYDDAADWYIVVDDEQVGPITASQIAEYIAAGRFTSSGYVWKEGLPDWVPLHDVDELQGLNVQSLGASSVHYDEEPEGYGQETEPTADDGGYQESPYQEAAGGYQQDAGYQDPSYQDDQGYQSPGYNAGADAGDFADAGYNAGDAGGSYGTFSDASAASAPSSVESTGGLFAAFDNPSSSTASSAGGFSSQSGPSGLVGQRSESSVLFSLSSLQQLSTQTTDKEANKGGVTEGSGLIDLQALASAHNALGSGGDAADDPFAQSTMALPPLAPMGSHKSNTPLIIGASIGGLLLLILLGVVLYLLLGKSEPEPVAVAPPPVQKEVIIREVVRESPEDEEVANEAEEAAKAAKAAARKNQQRAVAEKQKAEEPAAQEEEKEKKEEEEKDDDKKDSRRPSRPSSRPSRPSKPSKSSKKDGIDSILDKMDKKGGSKNDSKPARSTGLTKNQVGSTIRKYSPRVASCGKSSNRNKLSGKMTVRFSIRPNGSVTGVTVTTSKFRGTDVGRCAEKVLSAMKFPSSNATSNVPVSYPFTI